MNARALLFGFLIADFALVGALSWGCGESSSASPDEDGSHRDDAGAGANPGPTSTGSPPSGSDAMAADAGPVDPCTAYAQAICDAATRCTTNAAGPTRFECNDYSMGQAEAACRGFVGAPGTGGTASLLATCTASFATISCDAFLTGKLDPSCRPAGTFADGQACSFGSQCASGACANQAGPPVCGHCAPVTSDAGASCRDQECGPGLVCRIYSPDPPPVCVIQTGLGEPCDLAQPCGTDLYCVNGACIQSTGPGPCAVAAGLTVPCDPGLITLNSGNCACVRPQALGARCLVKSGDLASALVCDDGLYCKYGGIAGEGTCQPTTDEGQPCGYAESTAPRLTSACSHVDKDYCTATSAEGGTCVPLPAAGSPCVTRSVQDDISPVEENRCAADSRCSFTSPRTCTANLRLGDPCTGVLSCPFNSYCDGVCKAPPTAGEPCGRIGDSTVSCAADAYCKGATPPANQGTCAPLPKIGEACASGSSDLSFACADRAFCQTNDAGVGTCVLACE